MFLVLLKFGGDKAQAAQHMKDHNEWIQRGFDAGVFLLVGMLPGGSGGAILAHNTTSPELQSRVDADPFVAHGVVNAEIVEITPAKVDTRLNFLVS
jgi:uncharacterized protein YciI